MGIVDISTTLEAKAANYAEQCKLANHWNNFATKSEGSANGEFNVFFVDAKVLIESSGSQIIVEGHKQITNYWAGPASMVIKQKLRYSEFTSIETHLGIRVNSFSLFKRNVLKVIRAKLLSKCYQLNSNYYLTTNDQYLSKRIKNFWETTKNYRYTDHNLEIRYNSNNGRLKMKFYKMLDRLNELENLTSDFNLLINEIKKST